MERPVPYSLHTKPPGMNLTPHTFNPPPPHQVPGYTGHIHKHRETFGASFANATRVTPLTPDPLQRDDERAADSLLTGLPGQQTGHPRPPAARR